MGIDDRLMAKNTKFASDQEIVEVLAPAEQPSKYWMYLPALALLALVVVLQRGRARRVTATA